MVLMHAQLLCSQQKGMYVVGVSFPQAMGFDALSVAIHLLGHLEQAADVHSDCGEFFIVVFSLVYTISSSCLDNWYCWNIRFLIHGY
jgi:hypothetical protein